MTFNNLTNNLVQLVKTLISKSFIIKTIRIERVLVQGWFKKKSIPFCFKLFWFFVFFFLAFSWRTCIYSCFTIILLQISIDKNNEFIDLSLSILASLEWNGWWRNIFWILSSVGIGNKSGFNILRPWYFYYNQLGFWKDLDLKSKLLPAPYYTIITDTRLGNVKFRIADYSTFFVPKVGHLIKVISSSTRFVAGLSA